MRSVGVLVAVLAFLLSVAPARADFDFFDSETLNDRDAGGNEVPYTAAAERVFATPEFDTAGFTFEEGENAESPNYSGCVEPPTVFGARTAWVRFDPDVAGAITATAETPTYDSIIWVREAAQVPWGSATFSSLTGAHQCSDAVDMQGNETVTMPAVGDRVYYVQVGVACPTDRTSCESGAINGGPTTIRLKFEPGDGDGDGVADTNDKCADTPPKSKVTSSGCTDADEDGIADREEGRTCVGKKGVPWPDPQFNGCLAGPAPRDDTGPRVTIKSLDGDPFNTSSTSVHLFIIWKKGTYSAYADNKIGDEPKRIPLITGPIPWELAPASRRSQRSVSVHFRGPHVDDPIDNSIELDVRKPKVTGYVLAPLADGTFTLGIEATDDVSGIGSFRILDARKKLIRRAKVCAGEGKDCKRRVGRRFKRLSREPAYVAVRDAAGNERVRALSASSCRTGTLVMERGEAFGKHCFRVGQSCNGVAKRYYWSSSGFKCVRLGSRRVVQRA